MAKGDAYETFDSGSGPVVPKKSQEDFAHRDSDLSAKGDEVEHGAVPEIPQKSK